MQARGFLIYRSTYCWPRVIDCICQPNELERDSKKAGGASRGQAKIWGGYGPPRPPLRTATDSRRHKKLLNH